MGPHLPDRQEEVLGDLLVVGGRGEAAAALERAAEGPQHAPLGGGERDARDRRCLRGRRGRGLRGRRGCARAEGGPGSAEAQRVAVVQAPPAAHPLAVDEGAVTREAVVHHDPRVVDALEARVNAGDLIVPVEQQVSARLAADRRARPLGQEELLLPVVPVRELKEGPAFRHGQHYGRSSAGSRDRARSSSGRSASITCITALIRARWVNACGKLPRCRPLTRVDLLGVEQQRAGVGEQLLAQPAGACELADLDQRRHQPERADRERALLAREAVVGLLDPVAQHEALLGELVGDGQHGVADALVVGREEAHQRHQQHARRRARRSRSAGRTRRARPRRSRRCRRGSRRRRPASARPWTRRRGSGPGARRGRRPPST